MRQSAARQRGPIASREARPRQVNETGARSPASAVIPGVPELAPLAGEGAPPVAERCVNLACLRHLRGNTVRDFPQLPRVVQSNWRLISDHRIGSDRYGRCS